MLFLRQSTAVTENVGPFVDSTDGVTPEDSLGMLQAAVRLSKNGAGYAQKNEASAGTHDENGHYLIDFNTTDTGTLGTLKLAIYEVGALPVFEHYLVLPANVYDALVLGTDALQVDAIQISGDATAADNAESDYDGTGFDKANSEIGTVASVTLTDRVTLVDGVTLTDRTTLVDGVTLTDRVTLVDQVTLTDLVTALSPTERLALADAILKRGATNTDDTADEGSLTELILAVLNSSISSTTWTIKKVDTTTFNTRTLTLDDTADPIIAVAG